MWEFDVFKSKPIVTVVVDCDTFDGAFAKKALTSPDLERLCVLDDNVSVIFVDISTNVEGLVKRLPVSLQNKLRALDTMLLDVFDEFCQENVADFLFLNADATKT